MTALRQITGKGVWNCMVLEPITIHSLGLGALLLEQTCSSFSMEREEHTIW